MKHATRKLESEHSLDMDIWSVHRQPKLREISINHETRILTCLFVCLCLWLHWVGFWAVLDRFAQKVRSTKKNDKAEDFGPSSKQTFWANLAKIAQNPTQWSQRHKQARSVCWSFIIFVKILRDRMKFPIHYTLSLGCLLSVLHSGVPFFMFVKAFKITASIT